MSKILVVDDSPVDRLVTGRLLEKQPGLSALYASNGKDAMERIARDKPDLVLTDLQMPGMNGLELVLEVRLQSPLVPVILMTRRGSEELAVEALKRGAASYVPKRLLATHLLETVSAVLESSQGIKGQYRLMDCLMRTDSHFVLDNDPALIPPLVNFLKENVFRMCGSDDTGLIRMTVALREAVLNAMEHGNLELDSTLREQDETAYHNLAQERRKQAPYRDRRVFVSARETPAEAIYVIRDEGPGFDLSKLPHPHDPDNLEKVSGRGILLIRTFMTEVLHNERGNEITLIRRVD
jgi:DNA-binding response OmpR family regulator